MYRVEYTICDGDIDMPNQEFSTLDQAYQWLIANQQDDWAMQVITHLVDGQWLQTDACRDKLFQYS